MNKKELQLRHLAILNELDKIETTAEAREEGNRALTAEEQQNFDALMREDAVIAAKLRGMVTDSELANMQEHVDKSAQLREYFQGLMMNKRDDVTLTFQHQRFRHGGSG